jgi:hypothetical protein
MKTRLSKVAKYLEAQGFHAEAAQLQKLAGRKMSDWSPYGEPQRGDGRRPAPVSHTDEYFVEVPKETTVAQVDIIESRIKSVCERLVPFGVGAECKVEWDTKDIDGREVSGFCVTLEHVSPNRNSQTPLERIGESMGLDLTVHNLKEI